MSQFKNMEGYKLYYTDTDSAFFDRPLPDHMIGEGLGQMKLVGVYDEAVFIAPKVYGVKSGTESYTKIKGLKNKVEYRDLHGEGVSSNYLSIRLGKLLFNKSPDELPYNFIKKILFNNSSLEKDIKEIYKKIKITKNLQL